MCDVIGGKGMTIKELNLYSFSAFSGDFTIEPQKTIMLLPYAEKTKLGLCVIMSIRPSVALHICHDWQVIGLIMININYDKQPDEKNTITATK